ncbi:ATP-binding cassette sub-family B member 10, mitochondrial [Gonapodya prolifera JEL478]|uniref:ATP-binding cassette sub-family B member 10, mitochondrial n=1 Tax=Gonapodya prolifera (strain JEL478) TaxID=1344416 RepID=A0A139AA96_GONPJ|nr:ATP-binding cassette sub-family B member 10, mitochondrial [Gonapodya prolifera JEL478]|eukprot:KXS13731.1 ATP-binding cassette sub-family B member 10, mitochondrial [Gonapodya prolifera JEL478]
MWHIGSPAYRNSPLRSFSTSRLRLQQSESAQLTKSPPSNREESKPGTATTKGTPAEPTESGGWTEMRKIVEVARPEYPLLAGAGVMLVASSAVTMSVPWFMGKIVDVITEESLSSLTDMYPYIIALFAFGAAANAVRQFLFRYSGDRIVARLRKQLYESFLRRPLSFFDRTRTGELLSRLSADTSVVAKSITVNLSDGLRSAVMVLGGGGMLYYMSPQLTLIMASIIPPLAIAARYYGRFVRVLSRKTQDALASAVELAEEKIGGLRTVRAFALEKVEGERFGQKVDSVLDLARTEHVATATFFSSAMFAGNLTILAVLYFGSKLVVGGAMSVGELTSFLLYTGYTGGSLVSLGGFYSDVQKGLGAAVRVFGLIENDPEILGGKTPVEAADEHAKDGHPSTSESSTVATVSTTASTGVELPDLRGSLSFEDVWFHYPTRPAAGIFKGLSFSVKAGEVIGIVGQSGGGKSTVGNLLLRYYDPTSGIIKVDGHDIRTLNPSWWRRQVGVVSQEPVLFTGTIADNIAYGVGGRANTTMEQILQAAEFANARQFIEALPDGFDTLVGERGVNLSGGQKQRIAIARALLTNPKLLLFDEATSALDAESEHLVQQALDRLMVGRTVVTIAHRLSTIRNASRIFVVDDGFVLEEGSWNELMEKPDGVFRKLVRRQHSGQLTMH